MKVGQKALNPLLRQPSKKNEKTIFDRVTCIGLYFYIVLKEFRSPFEQHTCIEGVQDGGVR